MPALLENLDNEFEEQHNMVGVGVARITEMKSGLCVL
jgi:hypothetical protein